MERAFKGVWISKEIWLSKELTLQEKVFLAEIDSLDNDKGCYASNQHFGDFFGLSKNRCSEVIKSLEEKGLIKIKYIIKKGTKSIEKRVIEVVDKSNRSIREPDRPIRDSDRPIRETGRGYSGKLEGNNTFNNTINNTDNNTNKDSHIRDIFNHYISKNIIQHRKMTSSIRAAIKARLRDYSFEEIKKAIDNYAIVFHSNNHWFTHRYTLADFMRDKDIRKFLDEADPISNFYNRQRTASYNKPTFGKQEVIPDWMKKPQKQLQHELSAKEKREMEELVRRISE